MLFYLNEFYEEPFYVPLYCCFFLSEIAQYLYDFNPLFTGSLHTTDYTLYLTLKLIFSLLFLILIRGGVPRYRYDFLTKIGWVKFLGYVLSIFIISLTFFLF